MGACSQRVEAPSDKRQQKAQELLEHGVAPIEICPHKWTVASERDPQTKYVVEDIGGMWIYECPDFCYRGGLCKHILLVRLSLSSEGPQRKEVKKMIDVATTSILKELDQLSNHQDELDSSMSELLKRIESLEQR